jgi:hypothetical protein
MATLAIIPDFNEVKGIVPGIILQGESGQQQLELEATKRPSILNNA